MHFINLQFVRRLYTRQTTRNAERITRRPKLFLLKSVGRVRVRRNLYPDRIIHLIYRNGHFVVFSVHILIFPEPPEILIKPEDKEIKLGDSFSIRCSAKGKPVPTIKWYKDGKLLQEGETLLVVNSTSRHEGTYQCEANNKMFNTTDVATANVSVICK